MTTVPLFDSQGFGGFLPRVSSRLKIAFCPGRSQIPTLDGIRAVAALMVMFLHFALIDGTPLSLRRVALFGVTGVDLFFVLSGFLITRILLASKTSRSYFKTFY